MATIDEIESRDLVAAAASRGTTLLAGLDDIKRRRPEQIDWCLGKGLVAAVIFRESSNGMAVNEFTSRVAERCMQKGLLVVHTGRESIKLGPPLTIAEDALVEGIGVLDEAIAEIASVH